MWGNKDIQEVMEHLKQKILYLEKEKGWIVAALDGRCASGKTTVATCLAKELSSQVIHMDDFFLRPEQRTKARLAIPGGNVDYERVLREVMAPLKEGKDVLYTPYDCHSRKFKTPVRINHKRTILVEGAYACHPQLWDYSDLHVFFDIDEKKQMERIVLRNGSKDAVNFAEKWIPLEEAYLSAYGIKEKCELHYFM